MPYRFNRPIFMSAVKNSAAFATRSGGANPRPHLYNNAAVNGSYFTADFNVSFNVAGSADHSFGGLFPPQGNLDERRERPVYHVQGAIRAHHNAMAIDFGVGVIDDDITYAASGNTLDRFTLLPPDVYENGSLISFASIDRMVSLDPPVSADRGRNVCFFVRLANMTGAARNSLLVRGCFSVHAFTRQLLFQDNRFM